MGHIIFFSIIGILLQATFIYFEHKEKYVSAVILKGSASILFILLGLYATLKTGGNKLVFIGLILGGVGDILLNLRFVLKKIESKVFLTGVMSFLAGHILYLVAIINENTPVLYAILIGVIVSAITLFFIFSKLKVKLSYKIFGIVYITAVSLMSSVAISNVVVNPSISNIIYAIGALAFLISDIVLIFNSFGEKPKFSLRITNLAFYYVGQLLIASSLLFI